MGPYVQIKCPVFSGFHSFHILWIDHSKFDTDSTSIQRALAVFMRMSQNTRFRETSIFATFQCFRIFPVSHYLRLLRIINVILGHPSNTLGPPQSTIASYSTVVCVILHSLILLLNLLAFLIFTHIYIFYI